MLLSQFLSFVKYLLMGYLEALLARKIPEALEAAKPIAAKLSVSPEKFLASQASSRAYLIFTTSAEERARALKLAGNLIFAKKFKFPGPNFPEIKEHHDKMQATLNLLDAARQLGNPENVGRDFQVTGRATNYRLLLSPAATVLYPALTRLAPPTPLTLLLQSEILPLGPRGPLESEGAGGEFKKWAESRELIVADWECKLIQGIGKIVLTADIKRKLVGDGRWDKSELDQFLLEIVTIATTCFPDNSKARETALLLKKRI